MEPYYQPILEAATKATKVSLGPKVLVDIFSRVGSARMERELVQLGIQPELVTISSWLLGEKTAHVAERLGFTERTLRTRIRDRKPLDTLNGSSLLYLLRTWKAVLDLFDGNQEDALRWLHTPAPALGGEKPIDVIDTPQGQEMVQDLATALEYGVYV